MIAFAIAWHPNNCYNNTARTSTLLPFTQPYNITPAHNTMSLLRWHCCSGASLFVVLLLLGLSSSSTIPDVLPRPNLYFGTRTGGTSPPILVRYARLVGACGIVLLAFVEVYQWTTLPDLDAARTTAMH